MSDGFIQLPGDSTGKKVDTSELTVGAESVHRERYVAADPTSATGLATVTSSGGLTVHVTNPSTAVTVNVSTAVTVTNISTAVTVTNPSTEVNTLSSGPVLISGTVSVVSASSGLVQISGTPLVLTASSGYLVRSLSSGIVTLSSPTSLSSGIVTLSSVPTVTATGPTTITSGTVTLSSAPSVQQGASLISATSTGPWITDLRTQVYSSVPQYAEVSATSSGHVTIVSAVTSMSIYVLGYALIADSSNTIVWESSNTDLSGSMLFSTAGTGVVCPLVSPAAGAWLKTSVSGDLGLLVGNAGTIAGHLTYYTATS